MPRCSQRRYIEEGIQRTVIAHLKARAVPNTVYLHVPNGGARSPIEASILAGQGVKAGCPDLLIFSRGKPFALELKSPTGRVSPDHAACIEEMTAAGVVCAVCRGVDQAVRWLEGQGLVRGRMA